MKDKKIIIFGAGKIGKLLAKSLLKLGHNVVEFWDEYVDTETNNIPINKPNFYLENKDEYIVIITIFSENISYEISTHLSYLGFTTMYDKKEINKIIYLSCLTHDRFVLDLKTCHTCPVLRSVEGCKIFESCIVDYLPYNSLIVKNIGILITNNCNLSCAGCNHLNYLYDNNKDLTPKEIIQDLNKIVDVSDLICRLVIVGGEPFIHPEFYTILKRILKLPKIGIINIITNGTIIPNNKIIKLLKDEKIVIEISDYGNNLSKELQDNINVFESKLKEHKVNYLRINTLQWYNFGNFNKRNYSTEEHHNVYYKCCFVSNDLFRGKLYKCSRSAFGTLLKKIPDYKFDYLDIRNYPDLRNGLRHFLKKIPDVCKHCSGTILKLKTGVQI